MQSQKKKHLGHLWLFQGCPSYHTLIALISRLMCMVTQYVGMLHYQKILKHTQFVGYRAKNRPKTRRRKKAFLSITAILGVTQLPYHLWPFQGCPSYHMLIAMISRLLCMVTQYIGMVQFKKILKWTQFVGCRAENWQNTTKKGIWYQKKPKQTQFVACRAKNGPKNCILVIYGLFGVSQLPDLLV